MALTTASGLGADRGLEVSLRDVAVAPGGDDEDRGGSHCRGCAGTYWGWGRET